MKEEMLRVMKADAETFTESFGVDDKKLTDFCNETVKFMFSEECDDKISNILCFVWNDMKHSFEEKVLTTYKLGRLMENKMAMVGAFLKCDIERRDSNEGRNI